MRRQLPSLNHQQKELYSEIEKSISQHQFIRLVFSQPVNKIDQERPLNKVTWRIIQLDQPMLSSAYQFSDANNTSNLSIEQGLEKIYACLADFKQINLFCDGFEWQLKKQKQDKYALKKTQLKQQNQPLLNTAHDRTKKRWVNQQADYLQSLGITDHQQNIVPQMAKKWKQINKFIEIIDHNRAQIKTTNQPLQVMDFGSGKGYLTFALYDYLRHQLDIEVELTGVELRAELVKFCNQTAVKHDMSALQFFQGDVRDFPIPNIDIIIALHACDIATDYAIFSGISRKAQLIISAPCCHKELRPQLSTPTTLEPMLQFGLHQGLQAEMLTDSIRGTLLQAYGYRTKLIEFVALEHTQKNKMILAIKNSNQTEPDLKLLQKVQHLKQFYGIEQQCLEQLLLGMPNQLSA